MAARTRPTRPVNTVHLTAPTALRALAPVTGPRVERAVAKNLDVLKGILEA